MFMGLIWKDYKLEDQFAKFKKGNKSAKFITWGIDLQISQKWFYLHQNGENAKSSFEGLTHRYDFPQFIFNYSSSYWPWVWREKGRLKTLGTNTTSIVRLRTNPSSNKTWDNSITIQTS